MSSVLAKAFKSYVGRNSPLENMVGNLYAKDGHIYRGDHQRLHRDDVAQLAYFIEPELHPELEADFPDVVRSAREFEEEVSNSRLSDDQLATIAQKILDAFQSDPDLKGSGVDIIKQLGEMKALIEGWVNPDNNPILTAIAKMNTAMDELLQKIEGIATHQQRLESAIGATGTDSGSASNSSSMAERLDGFNNALSDLKQAVAEVKNGMPTGAAVSSDQDALINAVLAKMDERHKEQEKAAADERGRFEKKLASMSNNFAGTALTNKDLENIEGSVLKVVTSPSVLDITGGEDPSPTPLWLWTTTLVLVLVITLIVHFAVGYGWWQSLAWGSIGLLILAGAILRSVFRGR